MITPARPIGFIADDITGAADLASALAGRGLDTRLAFGADAVPEDGGDAIVVALKIRSVPAEEARTAAVAAATAMRSVGAEQLFFKYCSTFDSTPEGNIGPIADALADFIGADRVVHNPSYPANGRTVYRGHLFVGDELLSESPMRDHPLNPMRDSQLQRVLGLQTPRPVDLLTFPTVEAGASAVAARLGELGHQPGGVRHVIADAMTDADIETIASVTAPDRLAAGAAAYGAAYAAAAHALADSTMASTQTRASLPGGPAAIIAGSLSRATREQVERFEGPKLTLGIDDLVEGEVALSRAVEFAGRGLAGDAVLITTDHDSRADGSETSGLAAAEISRRIELSMGRIAIALELLGVRRLIVAGGETSGAVAAALSLRSARIGPDISVGVPWIVTDNRELAIAFKSGNFGGPSFFRDALAMGGR